MTDLFDRLYPPTIGTDNIAGHRFFAAMTDYAAGFTTRQEMINFWSLDAEAQVDLNALCDDLDAQSTVSGKMRWLQELHAVMMIAESGIKYATKSEFRTRIGI